MGVRSDFWEFGRSVAREMRENDVSLMAASIAYHAFISLLPMLVFLLFVLSLIDSQTLTANLVELTDSVLTPRAQAVLAESLTDDEARTRVSILGAATLVWGLFKIFRALSVTFADLYGIETDDSWLDHLVDGLVVVFALTVAVAAAVLAGAAFALFPDVPYLGVFNPLFLVVGLAVAFFPIYYVFPDADVTVREVVPGVVLAAVAWAALQAIFQGYVSYTIRFEAYGALGSALLLVVWLYFSSLVVLIGAVVNAVLGGWASEPAARTEPAEAAVRAERDRTELARAYDELARAYDELDSASDDLAAENRRLRERIESLDAENERLKRENARLVRRLQRRRWPVLARAKQWLFE